jgi:glucokinase
MGEGALLLGDIGGTNARFAIARDGAVTGTRRLKTADFATLEAALIHYLAGGGERPRRAAIAVASPLSGDRVKLTNSPWSFSISALRERLGLLDLRVYNDFAAVALSLPWLKEEERRHFGGPRMAPLAPIALVGPGTGLGVSGLVPNEAGEWLVLASEGGHAGFSPADAREDAVLAALRRDFGRLSIERLVSGQGIENLYRVTSGGTACKAAEVTALAEAGDKAAREALSLFSGIFGGFAGDLVLTLGAWRGLYIGGGIPAKLGPLFDHALFNARFEDKGRYRERLAAVPRWLITRDNPALLGLAHAAEPLRGAP